MHEVRSNPELFKLQGHGINHEERLENFCLILADHGSTSSTSTTLPTNQDILQVFDVDLKPEEEITENWISINDLCAAIWVYKGDTNWYIGYITSRLSETTYSVEHLQRTESGNLSWQYCDPPEELEVKENQLIKLKPEGEWDLENIRQTKFILKNHHEIQNEFIHVLAM